MPLLKHLIIVATFLFLFVIPANAADPNHKAGDQFPIWTWCMPDKADNTKPHDSFERAKKLMKVWNKQDHVALMSKNGTGCIDLRYFKVPPLPITLVNELEDEMVLAEGKGLCYHIWRFTRRSMLTVVPPPPPIYGFVWLTEECKGA